MFNIITGDILALKCLCKVYSKLGGVFCAQLHYLYSILPNLLIKYNLSKTATQKRTKIILMTNGSSMKVENIAEFSSLSILRYF